MKISVCIATYNGEKYIAQQLNSIIPQLCEDDEIIISDDMSSDGTIDIISSFNDPRITVILNKNPDGYAGNFENALRHATGDYIFLCDQDDVWLPNKIAVCTSYLNRSYDLVVHDAIVTDEFLNPIIESRNEQFNVRNGFLNNIIKTNYLGCCFAFKKSVLEYCLPFPPNRVLCKHDAWITWCAESKFKTIVIDEQLIYYRRHSNNASTGGVKKFNVGNSIAIRLYLSIQLLIRTLKKQMEAK